MEHDTLPRLSARLVDATSTTATSDATRVVGASTLKQMKQPLTESLKPPSPSDEFIRRRLHVQASQQSARPSSSRVAPRRATLSASPNQVATGGLHTGQVLQAECGYIQSENEQLRREISLLQQKLVEKMRGNAKILVSGGQFRASAPSPHARSPNAPHIMSMSTVQQCATCASLRGSIKMARKTANQEQQALAFRVSQLEHVEREVQTSRNHQAEELQSLRQQLQQLLTNDTASKTTIRCQHDQLQQLREVTASLETENEALRSQTAACDATFSAGDRQLKHTNAEGTQTEGNHCKIVAVQQDTASVRAEAVHRQLQQSQDECARLRSSVEELRIQLSDMETQRSLVVLQHTMERMTIQEQLTKAQDECSVLRIKNNALNETVSDLETVLQALQVSMDERQAAQSDQAADWQQQLVVKSTQFAGLLIQKAESDTLAATAQRRITEVEVLLRDAGEKIRLLEAQARKAAREIEGEREIVRIKSHELTVIKNECETNKTEGLRMREALQKTQVDLESCQTELVTLRTASLELSARLAAADAEIAALTDVQNQLKRSHAAALEKAVQSTVRLCVVAPTVNVHLGNNSVVTCKSTIPYNQVRTVVERDVLPLFATVFVQSQERCSPHGGPLDPWLQTVLRDMQETLAMHLQKLYSAATTVPVD